MPINWFANATLVGQFYFCIFIFQGKRVFFVTNNSSKTRQQYAERCKSLGFQAAEVSCTDSKYREFNLHYVEPLPVTKLRKCYTQTKFNTIFFTYCIFFTLQNEIVCTSWLLAAYLKDVVKYDGKVYVIGGAAIETEFKNKGLNFIGIGVSVISSWVLQIYGRKQNSLFFSVDLRRRSQILFQPFCFIDYIIFYDRLLFVFIHVFYKTTFISKALTKSGTNTIQN